MWAKETSVHEDGGDEPRLKSDIPKVVSDFLNLEDGSNIVWKFRQRGEDVEVIVENPRP